MSERTVKIQKVRRQVRWANLNDNERRGLTNCPHQSSGTDVRHPNAGVDTTVPNGRTVGHTVAIAFVLNPNPGIGTALTIKRPDDCNQH